MFFAHIPRRRRSRGRRRRNPSSVPGALTFANGPDVFLKDAEERLVSMLPQFEDRINSVFMRNRAVMRQMVISSAVEKYNDEFMRDVMSILPEIIEELS